MNSVKSAGFHTKDQLLARDGKAYVLLMFYTQTLQHAQMALRLSQKIIMLLHTILSFVELNRHKPSCKFYGRTGTVTQLVSSPHNEYFLH